MHFYSWIKNQHLSIYPHLCNVTYLKLLRRQENNSSLLRFQKTFQISFNIQRVNVKSPCPRSATYIVDLICQLPRGSSCFTSNAGVTRLNSHFNALQSPTEAGSNPLLADSAHYTLPIMDMMTNKSLELSAGTVVLRLNSHFKEHYSQLRNHILSDSKLRVLRLKSKSIR